MDARAGVVDGCCHTQDLLSAEGSLLFGDTCRFAARRLLAVEPSTASSVGPPSVGALVIIFAYGSRVESAACTAPHPSDRIETWSRRGQAEADRLCGDCNPKLSGVDDKLCCTLAGMSRCSLSLTCDRSLTSSRRTSCHEMMEPSSPISRGMAFSFSFCLPFVASFLAASAFACECCTDEMGATTPEPMFCDTRTSRGLPSCISISFSGVAVTTASR
mmetsp:Transcript_19446/g.35255  ORF Transcript_19446/g.35255 Transcript_19446/m.35255 type:complete len:217 (-) Transcript_19446:244-894(-)